MAAFSRVSLALASFTPLHQKAGPKQRYPSPYPSLSPERRLDEDEPIRLWSKSTHAADGSTECESVEDLEGNTLLETTRPKRKRPATPRKETRSAKRQKSDDGYRPGEDGYDSTYEGETLFTSSPTQKSQPQSTIDSRQDGRAMPPPPKPGTRLADMAYVPARDMGDRDPRNSKISFQSLNRDSILDEDEIFTQKMACRRQDRSEVNPQFEYDRAFRHAQAQELPDDSGVWSEVEKDLFYRLAMRGFEPLLPGHWAMDFKTLPQMLLAAHGQEAPITPFNKREFRAKHYLRNLFSIASKVRDRSLVGLPTEPCIQRPLKQYISWALSDAGVDSKQRPKAMPVHAMVCKKPGENAHEVLRRMSTKLFGLARRYQDRYRVRQSVEAHASSTSEETSSSVLLTQQYDDAHMPTLIGLMLVSSVVAVVTVHSRPTPPDPVASYQNRPRRDSTHSSPSSSIHSPSPPSSPANTAIREDSGLRVIANFDFSTDDGYDVWDGLALAICVMRIRKSMLELAALAEREGQTGPGGLWEKLRPMEKALSHGDEEDR